MIDIKILRLNGKKLSIMDGIDYVFNHGATTFDFIKDGVHIENQRIKSVERINGQSIIICDIISLNGDFVREFTIKTPIDFRKPK